MPREIESKQSIFFLECFSALCQAGKFFNLRKNMDFVILSTALKTRPIQMCIVHHNATGNFQLLRFQK
jgi:hypothetical protein